MMILVMLNRIDNFFHQINKNKNNKVKRIESNNIIKSQRYVSYKKNRTI
jgi:hypothetical protein